MIFYTLQSAPKNAEAVPNPFIEFKKWIDCYKNLIILINFIKVRSLLNFTIQCNSGSDFMIALIGNRVKNTS